MLEFHWSGVIGMAISAAAAVLAWIVYRAAPDRRQNRLLALLLALEAVALNGGAGIIYLITDPATAAGWQMTNVIAQALAFWVYGEFLATLDGAPGRWMRKGGKWLFRVHAAFVMTTAVIDPGWYVAGISSVWYAASDSHAGVLRVWSFYPMTALYLLGLIVALGAVAATPRGTMGRRQAVSYTLAFVLRDALFAAVLVLFFTLGAQSARWTDVVLLTGVYASTASLVGFLALGILRNQIFHIDLRLKFTISRGTIAATIAGAAFLGSELIEYAFGAEQLWTALAIAAASAFALRPLVKLGDRVADRALPGVEDSPAYRNRRTREIYEAAFQSAMLDGVVTQEERDMLGALQEQLGLTPGRARAIERGLTKARTRQRGRRTP